MSQGAGRGKSDKSISHMTLWVSSFDVFRHFLTRVCSVIWCKIQTYSLCVNMTPKTTAVILFPGQKFGHSMPCVCAQLGPNPSFRLCPRPQISQRGKWPPRAQSCPMPSPVHATLVLTLHSYSMSCHLPSICTERLPLRRCPLSSLGPQRPVWYSTQGTICSTVSDSRKGRTDSQTAHARLLVRCLRSSQNFHDNPLQIAHRKNWDSTHLK